MSVQRTSVHILYGRLLNIPHWNTSIKGMSDDQQRWPTFVGVV